MQNSSAIKANARGLCNFSRDDDDDAGKDNSRLFNSKKKVLATIAPARLKPRMKNAERKSSKDTKLFSFAQQEHEHIEFSRIE